MCESVALPRWTLLSIPLLILSITCKVLMTNHSPLPYVSACPLLNFMVVRTQECHLCTAEVYAGESGCRPQPCDVFSSEKTSSQLHSLTSDNSGSLSINICCFCGQYAEIMVITRTCVWGELKIPLFYQVSSEACVLRPRTGMWFYFKIPVLLCVSWHLCTNCCLLMYASSWQKYYPMG